MTLMRLLLVVSLLFSSVALAEPSGLYLTEGLMGYAITFNNSPTSVTQRQFLSSETGLGYIIGGVVYLGGVFNYTAVNEQMTDSGNNAVNHQETYQYYGPSLGYIDDGWVVIAHYFANAEQKDNISGATSGNTDRTGTGYGINVGYRWVLGSFEFGPTMAFKSINYVNCKDPSGATNTCSPTITQTEFTPYLTLYFNFK
jgi:hypothetical protein